MKYKGIFFIIFVSISYFLCEYAFGEEVQLENKSSKEQDLFSNVYADVSLRHYTEIQMQDDNVTNQVPKLQLRPTIGNRFYDGKLDLKLIHYFEKKPDTTQVTQLQPRAVAEYSALDSKYVAIYPYLDYRLPHRDSGATIIPAGYFLLHGNVSTILGELGASSGLDVGVLYSSREEQVIYRQDHKRDSANLSKAGEETSDENGEQGLKKDPDLYHVFDGQISLKPSANLLRKFSFAATTWLYSEYSPEYTITGETADQETMTYKLKKSSENRFRVQYDANKTVSLYNDLHTFHQGHFEKQTAGKRYMNVLWLSCKLK